MDLPAPHARYQALLSLVVGFCTSNLAPLRLAGLVGILLFSFWSGMSPHWDYPYPLHVDEWFAIGYAQSTLDAGGLEYPNPYHQWETSFSPELGFHLLLGFLKTITGLSWMSLYRVAPGVSLALLAFLTYAFARRLGFGWAAAIFVSLIPTSVRTLGPAFLVPVSAAMLFIPVTLLILHTMGEENRGKSLWILMLLIGGAIFVHPPTEVVITALAVLYLIGFIGEALIQRQYGKGSRLLLALLVRISIPALILGLWLPSITKRALEDLAIGASESLTSSLGLHTGFFEAFGLMAVGVSFFGLFIFIARGDFGLRSYMLPVFTSLLLAFLVFFFPVYKLGPNILYDRGWLYLGLLMAILAGYGVAVYFRSIPSIARFVAARFRRLPSARTTVSLWAIGTAVVALVLIASLGANDGRTAYTGYYHVINEAVFADFQWIGRHTAPKQTVAMGEPSIAWAYPPIAGPNARVFQAISAPSTNHTAEKVRQMLSLGEADVSWLSKSGISVFYTCRPTTFVCEELIGDELFNVRRGVYLVPNTSEKR